jgi:hypothetical protein
MNRDVPPCISALRASLQPLIGGAIECVRRAVALVRTRSCYIRRRRGTQSMGVVKYPSCLLLFVDGPSPTPQRSPTSRNRRPPRHVPSHLPHPPVPTRETPDQPSSCSRRVIPAPAHRVRAGGSPRPALRSNGPWPHVTSGLLAPPGIIVAILIFRPLSDPLCVGYRLRAIASWVPGVPGAHRKADWKPTGAALWFISTQLGRAKARRRQIYPQGHISAAQRGAAARA